MLNKTDLFPIGIGTWGIGGFVERDSSIDEENQVKAMQYMIDSGMNFVEANLWYSEGYSIEILQKALNKSDRERKDLFICQAVYMKNGGLETVEDEVDQMLKIFETDYIDTLQFTQSTFLKYKYEEIKTIKVPHGDVVDTTAAGDSFNGAFLALYNNNKNIQIEDNILKSHSITREVIKHKGAIISKEFMPKLN